MNTTHLHLLLNHFPIIGTLMGCTLMLWGIIKNQNNIKIASSILLVLMAIIAIPVYLTGEPAEESVEKLPGVLESMIELHEDAASLAIWLMGITGVSALMALFLERQKSKIATNAFLATFIFSIICFAAMARTGYYGGQIRHTEINAGATTAVQQINSEKNPEGKENKKGKEKDDD